jgi:hypothetical protein
MKRTRRVLVGLVQEIDRLVEGKGPHGQLVLVHVVQQDRVLGQRERQVGQALQGTNRQRANGKMRAKNVCLQVCVSHPSVELVKKELADASAVKAAHDPGDERPQVVRREAKERRHRQLALYQRKGGAFNIPVELFEAFLACWNVVP